MGNNKLGNRTIRVTRGRPSIIGVMKESNNNNFKITLNIIYKNFESLCFTLETKFTNQLYFRSLENCELFLELIK